MTNQPCQRWRNHRDSYRPAGEPIDPSLYGVDLLPECLAKEFVKEHHYSGTYPAAVCRVGLFRWGGELVGCAVFSQPAQNAAIPAWCGTEAGVELGRFVLVDNVPANGETWFLRRAFKLLRQEKPHLEAVLSYSDPVRRVNAAGDIVLPGHVGTIYQAFNGRYVGRSRARTLNLTPDGQVLSGRALSKIRLGERGDAYAYEQLLKAGAPRRRSFESGRAYVKRALAEGPFTRFRHPGNHAYVWSLTRRHRIERPALPYPKQVEVAL
jgi:hypothetical protein